MRQRGDDLLHVVHAADARQLVTKLLDAAPLVFEQAQVAHEANEDDLVVYRGLGDGQFLGEYFPVLAEPLKAARMPTTDLLAVRK